MAKGRKTGGRQKGTPNRVTVIAKEAIEDAFAYLQDVPGKSLRDWAQANEGEFYKLIFPRLLPVQMEHSGEIDHNVRQIERAIRYPEDRDSSDLRAPAPSLPI